MVQTCFATSYDLHARFSMSSMVMMRPSMHDVALEFGFPDAMIRKALREHAFERASDLIDYLDKHWNHSDADIVSVLEGERLADAIQRIDIASSLTYDEEMASIVTLPSLPPPPYTPSPSSILYRETKRLYRQSFCMGCKSKPRHYVLLPCSCFALCESCLPLYTCCPRDKTKITHTIRTYTI